jgi:hypothetical protein
LVDSPRFATQLVRRIEELGGIRWMFLTHVDDIADHALFHRHFGCDRIIHQRETRAASGMERVLEGDDPHSLQVLLLVLLAEANRVDGAAAQLSL